MDYKSLWDTSALDDLDNTTDNIIDIMKQQAQHLRKATDGKVLARFRKIKNITTNLVEAASILSGNIFEEQDAIPLEDANRLYISQRYGFEIYNPVYKFRIFEMDLTPLYPVSVYFGEGVLEDTRSFFSLNGMEDVENKTRFIIKSDSEFMDSLKVVFSCKKVKYILYKLQKL